MPNENNDERKTVEFEMGELRKHEQSIDPNLQRVASKVETTRSIEPRDAPASLEMEGDASAVALIGQLRDPAVPVPGLTIDRMIDDLFIGQADARDLEAISGHENVVSVKLAERVYPTLDTSVAEIHATQAQITAALPNNGETPDGTGVIVGIIDYGCDFVHDNFRKADDTTRLLFLWDQSGGFDPNLTPTGFFHGREFDSAAIDAALLTPNPYDALGYTPAPASHGTHVMDIAAGNGRATGHPGVAPEADLIFVELGSGGVGQAQSFGDSKNLIEAVEYIFSHATALGRPAVINLSVETHGGPHDGSTPAERWFDRLLDEPGRAIVIAAGNSRQDQSHTSGVVQPGTPHQITWTTEENDPTKNELEIWYAGQHRLEVSLITPGGQQFSGVPRGHSLPLSVGGNEIISIIHNEQTPDNDDNQISILLDEWLFSNGFYGDWQVELTAIGAEDVPFHGWIERDDAKGAVSSRFAVGDTNPSYTLGSISCGARTITVGSYIPNHPNRNISGFSAEGPTRDDKQKPEVSAPGQAISAAKARSNGSVSKSGTSMAAPHVTGLIALIMQAAGRLLTIDEIRDAVLQSARRNPPSGVGWDGRYGAGRVDATAALLI